MSGIEAVMVDVLSYLRTANQTDRVVRRELTRMAETGGVAPDEVKRLALAINEILMEMGDARGVKLIKRTVEEARPEIDTPSLFREAYEKLHLRSYQSASSPSMTSDRGMAVYGKKGKFASGKPSGDSSRAVIRDRRLWEYKRRVDKKLRKLAGEIELQLSGYSGDRTEQKRCTACKKLGEDDWSYCPRCGGKMEFDDVC